jgi:hypothetical protein
MSILFSLFSLSDTIFKKRYTNHSLRSTTVHNLDSNQFAGRHITSITVHRSQKSFKTYTGYRVVRVSLRKSCTFLMVGIISPIALWPTGAMVYQLTGLSPLLGRWKKYGVNLPLLVNNVTLNIFTIYYKKNNKKQRGTKNWHLLRFCTKVISFLRPGFFTAMSLWKTCRNWWFSILPCALFGTS